MILGWLAHKIGLGEGGFDEQNEHLQRHIIGGSRNLRRRQSCGRGMSGGALTIVNPVIKNDDIFDVLESYDLVDRVPAQPSYSNGIYFRPANEDQIYRINVTPESIAELGTEITEDGAQQLLSINFQHFLDGYKYRQPLKDITSLYNISGRGRVSPLRGHPVTPDRKRNCFKDGGFKGDSPLMSGGSYTLVNDNIEGDPMFVNLLTDGFITQIMNPQGVDTDNGTYFQVDDANGNFYHINVNEHNINELLADEVITSNEANVLRQFPTQIHNWFAAYPVAPIQPPFVDDWRPPSPPIGNGMPRRHRQKKVGSKNELGAGIIDSVKHIFGNSSKYNNTSRKTLEKYGRLRIKEVIATREVVNKYVMGFMNAVSKGKLDVEKAKLGYDNFFHIRLYVRLENSSLILIEKNEVIMIEPVSKIQGEQLPIPKVGNYPTLIGLMEKAQSYMGSNFFTYDPYLNNCASFVVSVLKANGLWNEKDTQFLYQDVSTLAKKLPESHMIGKFVTKLGAVVSRIRGKGRVPYGDAFTGGKRPHKIKHYLEKEIAYEHPAERAAREREEREERERRERERAERQRREEEMRQLDDNADPEWEIGYEQPEEEEEGRGFKGGAYMPQQSSDLQRELDEILNIIKRDLYPDQTTNTILQHLMNSALIHFGSQNFNTRQFIDYIMNLYRKATEESSDDSMFDTPSPSPPPPPPPPSRRGQLRPRNLMDDPIFTGGKRTKKPPVDYSLPENKEKLDVYNKSPLADFSVSELRAIAKKYKKHTGLGAVSKMTKINLIHLLHQHLDISEDGKITPKVNKTLIAKIS